MQCDPLVTLRMHGSATIEQARAAEYGVAIAAAERTERLA